MRSEVSTEDQVKSAYKRALIKVVQLKKHNLQINAKNYCFFGCIFGFSFESKGKSFCSILIHMASYKLSSLIQVNVDQF